MIQTFSQKLADKIASNTNANAESKAVILYGIIAITHTAFFMLLITILGILTNLLFPIWVVCMSAAVLRRNSGGAHAENSVYCTSIGSVVCLFLSFLSKIIIGININITIFIISGVAIFLIAVFAIWRLCPVDTPNKPIKSKSKIKRMRRNSFITLAAYFLLSAISIYFGINNPTWVLFAICLWFGLIWQLFMLTKAGLVFLTFIQKILTSFINLFKKKNL